VGPRRHQATASRHDLPVGGLHPPEGHALPGEVRFSQSYTYFTWRNTKDELTEYFTELTQTDVREYMRPNLFANTPDILHAYLQRGGRPAFQIRLVLAATLGASYGIYSGYELSENVPVREGSEEYLDSEKYQIRPATSTSPAASPR
jgi:starch synthase (maltosyl-transferring)